MFLIRRLAPVAVLVAIAFTADPVSAQRDGRGPARGDARGQLKAVDEKAGTITITQPEGRGTPAVDQSYKLAADVEVAVDGGRRGLLQPAKFANMPAGTLIALTLSPEKTVECVIAEGPTVRGVVKIADLQKRTLTVGFTAGRRDGEATEEEKTYSVPADAEIVIDEGKARRFSVHEGKLEDLAGGSLVTLRLALNQKQAVNIFAEGPSFTGLVKSVDAGKKTITLTIGGGREAADERTFDVAADAMTILDDGRGRRLSLKEGKLADIPAGSMAIVKLSADQKAAAMIRAEGAMLTGQLKAVDATKGTVTVVKVSRTDPPDEKTLPVAKDARIVVEGQATKLADLKPGDDVIVSVRLSLDQKTIQGITIGRGRGRE